MGMETYTRWNLSTLLGIAIHPYTSALLVLQMVHILSLPLLSFVLNAIPWSLRLIVFLLCLYRAFTQLVLKTMAQAKPHLPLSKEVAIITGGSSGIGLALAQTLALEGVRVAIWDIQPPVETVEDRLWIRYYQGDVTQLETVQELFQKTESELGPVTLLINNAGIVKGKSLMDLTERDIQKTFQVNALAHFWTVQAVLPKFMERRYGHVITLASTMGLVGVAHMSDYCASKFAAVGFHESLRQEINNLPFPHLIRTTLVCPGLILTGMFHGIQVKYPFILCPLTPKQVVDRLMDAIRTGVIRTVVNEDGNVHVDDTQLGSVKGWHRWFQHQVIWIPYAFYLPVWAQSILPVSIMDRIKDWTGGNTAIDRSFVGRGVNVDSKRK